MSDDEGEQRNNTNVVSNLDYNLDFLSADDAANTAIDDLFKSLTHVLRKKWIQSQEIPFAVQASTKLILSQVSMAACFVEQNPLLDPPKRKDSDVDSGIESYTNQQYNQKGGRPLGNLEPPKVQEQSDFWARRTMKVTPHKHANMKMEQVTSLKGKVRDVKDRLSSSTMGGQPGSENNNGNQGAGNQNMSSDPSQQTPGTTTGAGAGGQKSSTQKGSRKQGGSAEGTSGQGENAEERDPNHIPGMPQFDETPEEKALRLVRLHEDSHYDEEEVRYREAKHVEDTRRMEEERRMERRKEQEREELNKLEKQENAMGKKPYTFDTNGKIIWVELPNVTKLPKVNVELPYNTQTGGGYDHDGMGQKHDGHDEISGAGGANRRGGGGKSSPPKASFNRKKFAGDTSGTKYDNNKSNNNRDTFVDGFTKLADQRPDISDVIDLKPGVKLVDSSNKMKQGPVKDENTMSVAKYQQMVDEIDGRRWLGDRGNWFDGRK